jgi:hypothetical protein
MQQIILSLSQNQYSIASPYDDRLVNCIKQIDRDLRSWEKPHWKIQSSNYNSQPVVDYLRKICQEAGNRLDIPFLDETIAASPIEQIKARVAISVERFKKLVDLCDRLEPNSFRFRIEPNGLTIYIHEMLEKEEYQQLRSIADTIETTQEFYLELTDAEIIKLWEHPATLNRPLIELQVLETFANNIQKATDSEGKKYICTRNTEADNAIPATIGNDLTYAIPVSKIINLSRLLNNPETLQTIRDYNLQDDFVAALKQPEEYAIDKYRVNHQDRFNANKYIHPYRDEIEWFRSNTSILLELGVNITPYIEQFNRINNYYNSTAIEQYKTAIKDAIDTTKETLLNNYTKDELLNWIDTNLPTATKKSWSKAKIIDELYITLEFAIDYLKIPPNPTLIDV